MQGVDKGFLLYNGAQQMFGHDELVPVRLGLSLCGSECLVYEYRIFYIHIVSFFLFFFLRGDGEPEGETFIACHAGGFLYFGVGDVV